MDLRRVSKLTDEQLIALYRNPTTDKIFKRALLKEITSRELEELNSEIDEQEIPFTQSEKLRLLFLPFFYRYHRKTMLSTRWSRDRDKTFWKYLTYGIALYCLLLCIGLLFRDR